MPVFRRKIGQECRRLIFSWDKTAYVLGVTAGEGKRTAEEHRCLRNAIIEVALAETQSTRASGHSLFPRSWSPTGFVDPLLAPETLLGPEPGLSPWKRTAVIHLRTTIARRPSAVAVKLVRPDARGPTLLASSPASGGYCPSAPCD